MPTDVSLMWDWHPRAIVIAWLLMSCLGQDVRENLQLVARNEEKTT